jgi:NADPH:quinone reductase-like Zn-dependent oxidoreductase
MKAVVCTGYGPPDVLELREVAKPVPRDSEVLIRIHATPVTAMDFRIRGLDVPLGGMAAKIARTVMRLRFGLTRPRQQVLGGYLAGEIETVGKGVRRFKAGDRVFARTGLRFGACAQYVCLPETGMLTAMPSNLTFEEAAAIPYGGANAMYFLKRGGIRSGQKVLVYGASGAIGTSAVQLARIYGAQVTGVCSTQNMELVKSLGADKAIDYTKEDFTKSNELFDIIFDAVGKISYAASQKCLAANGKYVSVFTSGQSRISERDLVFLRELVEEGKIRPVVDRCYPLEQTAEAHRYVERGHKKGNVIITMK